MIWLWPAAGMMAASAAVHTLAGQKRLLGPLLAQNDGILANGLARQVFRFAWYATSVLMLLSAATVAWPGVPHGLIGLIGAAWTATGIANAVMTRGRHVIWPLLTAGGLCAVAGAVS